MSAATNLRRETALLLGFPDVEALTPSQSVRVDMVAGLRLEHDRLQAMTLRGEAIDARQFVAVSEQLEAALRPTEPAPVAAGRSEVRERLKAIIDATILAGPPQDQPSRAELEAEIERLREELARAQAGAVPAVTMPSADIVPLRPAPAPTPPQPALPDAELQARLAYAERLQKIMTRQGTEEWRNTFSTSRGIHDIPRGW